MAPIRPIPLIDGVLYDKAVTILINYPAGKSDTSFVIPNSVTTLGEGAFAFCTSLTSITIPTSVTSIEPGAFVFCTSLTSIEIPKSVTSINYDAFFGCTQLMQVEDGVLYVDKWAIGSDENATSVSLRTDTVGIARGAFRDCDSLISITIPEGVTGIGYGVFYNCENLISVTIPASVTSIGNSAFYNCENLISVTIPASVTSIDSQAFMGCTLLTSVIFAETSGWVITDHWNGGNKVSVSASDLSNPATAAEYLTLTYSYGNYYWNRSVE